MSSVVAGARLAVSRLRCRASLVAFLLGLGLVATVALLEHRSAPLVAADETLVGAVFGITVPLFAYLAVERSADGRRLDQSLDELARHGANRRGAVLGLLAVCAFATAAAGAFMALVGVLLARGTAGGGLSSDLLASGWIGAASGVAYTCWFAFGSSFGRRGGGRMWALALDWVLGSTTTVMAIPWPRGHIRNLLGAAPVLGLSQLQGGLVLGALSCTYLGLCLWRITR